MDAREVIKKLFAVAEDDASTDGEIDNAMRSAMNLMAAYRITREDLFVSGDEAPPESRSFAKQSVYSQYTSLTLWETYLAWFVIEYVPGTAWYRRRGVMQHNKYGMATGIRSLTEITFYGPSQDVQMCVDIWNEAVVVITAAARLRFGSALSRGDAAAYAEGFTTTIYESAKRQKQVMSQDKQYALVCVQTALTVQKEAQKWLAESEGIRLGKGRSSTASSRKYACGDAYAQGKADGANYKPGATRKAGYLNVQ